MIKAVTLTVLMMFPILAFAAGGGSMPSMPQSQVKKTPTELAVDSYNAGIKNRDKAWAYQAKAALEADPKKIIRLEKKADKQFNRAIKKFRSAIKNEPRLYQAHGSLGYALKQTGDFSGAMAAYDQCLALQPAYMPAIEYRAEANLALGEIDKTQAAYLQLSKVDPRLAEDLERAIKKWLDDPPRNTAQDLVDDMRNWFAGVTKTAS